MTSPTISKIPVSLIGLPYLMGTRLFNFGYQMAKGPELLLAPENAPKAMREVFEDVEVFMVENVDEPNAGDTGGDYRLLPVGDQMSRILVQNIHLAAAVREARARGRIAIASVGACSASLGMVGGISEAEGPIGMVWFDAHGDAQTPDTSSNGFFEGMPVTTIAGKCWHKYRRKIPGFREIPEELIITVGLSEMFAANGRPHAGAALGALVHKPVIEEFGFEGAMTRTLDALRKQCGKVFVHIDTDVLDPSVLRANTHAAVGGLTDIQLSRALDLIAERFEIVTVDFASFDPAVDPRGAAVLVPLLVQAAKATAMSIQNARAI
jgi:arginase